MAKATKAKGAKGAKSTKSPSHQAKRSKGNKGAKSTKKASAPKKPSAKKKAPARPPKKKAPKKRSTKTIHNDQADTVVDARRPVPGIQPEGKKKGWRWADLLLTLLFVLALGTISAGIWVVNRWSIQQGAQSVHAMSIAHVPERARAYVLHLKKQYSPPAQHKPSLGYEKEIQAAALKYRLPANLLKAMIKTGSGFQPDRVDRYGAIGLMQITPSASKAFHTQTPQLFHPLRNIRLGARLLRRLIKSSRKKQSYQQLLARYFNVSRGLPQTTKKDGPDSHYAWKVVRAFQSFQKDPGQEIRRASKRNRQPRQKRRPWLSWKRLKSLVKRQ